MRETQRILLQDKPSAAEIPVYWCMMGLGMTICFLLLAQFVDSVPFLRSLFLLFIFLTLALSGLRIVIDLAERQVSLYTLTDECLSVRRGFNQRINTIPIEHVQQIMVRKPILGLILNYGTLVVKGPGFSFAKIDRVPSPDKWQSTILALRHIH
jgi:membrane protein YdbS with pleckstrin-like domain